MNTVLISHVTTELIIIGSITFYFSKRIKTSEDIIESLTKRLTESEQKVESLYKHLQSMHNQMEQIMARIRSMPLEPRRDFEPYNQREEIPTQNVLRQRKQQQKPQEEQRSSEEQITKNQPPKQAQSQEQPKPQRQQPGRITVIGGFPLETMMATAIEKMVKPQTQNEIEIMEEETVVDVPQKTQEQKMSLEDIAEELDRINTIDEE